MAQERLTWEERGSIPEELKSAEAKLVYLYVSLHDGITRDELKEKLHMNHTSLLSTLDLLEENGYVDCDDAKYRCV